MQSKINQPSGFLQIHDQNLKLNLKTDCSSYFSWGGGNAYLFFCLGSGLQVQLYEDFAKSRAKCDIDETVSSISMSEETEKPKLKATGHVFQVHFT